MPVTATELPILIQFFCRVEKSTRMPPVSAPDDDDAPSVDHEESTPKKLPKGVVLGKDGKPCRSCTSVASWMQMAKAQNPSKPAVQATTSTSLPSDCPADVEALGRSTWTMLHTLTANYPSAPSPAHQQQTKSFISLFSNLYPCSHCAEDFRDWMRKEGNAPRVGSRDDFGVWMCEAHNAVNEKLGKERFDCGLWKERWRDGPANGSCG